MRLLVSLASGETLSLELPLAFEEWEMRQADPEFQRSIRSLALVHDGQHHALGDPGGGFGAVAYMAELRTKGDARSLAGAEVSAARIGYQADDVLVWLTVYFSGTMSRTDVRRVGRSRWQPAGVPAPRRRANGLRDDR